jgi:glutathione S-transferase
MTRVRAQPVIALHDWPGIQGRGEFVRLALEAAGVAWRDMAVVPEADGGGIAGVERWLRDPALSHLPFEPPILCIDEQVIGGLPAILLHLGDRFGLAPRDEALRLWAHQIQVTIDGFLTELDQSQPPAGNIRQPDDQRAETIRRSAQFIAFRLPRLLVWLETVAERNALANPSTKSDWMVGRRLSHVDLSVTQLLEGLAHALPRVSTRLLGSAPRLCAVRARVLEQPNIRHYLDSGRQIPFDSRGLFRHHAELDL